MFSASPAAYSAMHACVHNIVLLSIISGYGTVVGTIAVLQYSISKALGSTMYVRTGSTYSNSLD